MTEGSGGGDATDESVRDGARVQKSHLHRPVDLTVPAAAGTTQPHGMGISGPRPPCGFRFFFGHSGGIP